ncbi:MAG: FAD-binding oxidoreductase [Ktedonobacteraceae bacterium]
MRLDDSEAYDPSWQYILKQMGRREFLALGATGVLAACQSDTIVQAGAPTPTPTKPPSLTNADWSALARALRGPLVQPDSPQYATARQLFSARFDTVRPAAIAYCTSPADVQACLAFARKFALPFAIRGGGHSYEGYSTTSGLVIDVTRIHAVSINAGIATVGAGTRLIDVYGALTQQGLILPAGSCPTVGIAGLTMGGGNGVLGRKFGLTCDNLLSAQVVLANGRVLTCDANHDPDLFWALRGGGGGNFGVATSFTFQTHQVSTLSLFTFTWAWDSAVAVVDAWQNWAPHAPDELWSNCVLIAPADKGAAPFVVVNGVYVGEVGPLSVQLDQLTSRIAAPPASRYVTGASVLNTMLYEAGCSGKTIGQCHLPSQDPQGQVQRDTSSVKSDYFTTALSRQGIAHLVDAITKRHASSTLGNGGIGMDAYGGALNRVAPDATAFAHRNALFSAQYSASWNASDAASVVAANRAWLNDTWNSMRPFASGGSYQNYVDPDLPDWQHAYYGANLARLRRIKKTYDPTNLFHFAQSIPPA